MQDDFKPVLLELLASHPGLEFLQSTPEFQERYGMITIIWTNICQNLFRITVFIPIV